MDAPFIALNFYLISGSFTAFFILPSFINIIDYLRKNETLMIIKDKIVIVNDDINLKYTNFIYLSNIEASVFEYSEIESILNVMPDLLLLS